MRVVVCGSRDFDDDEVLDDVLRGLLMTPWIWYGDSIEFEPNEKELVIIEGQCPHGGADKLAEEWAKRRGIKHEPFKPKSNTAVHFHERNRAMVDSGADLVIAFINKPFAESRGTKSTVEYARKKGVKTIVIEVA